MKVPGTSQVFGTFHFSLFTFHFLYAPIAQGIEHWSPEPCAEVRVLLGAYITISNGLQTYWEQVKPPILNFQPLISLM
jgi:hypothetical protein